LKLAEVPKPADAADALAIAITAAWKSANEVEDKPLTKSQRVWQEAQAAAANSNRR
jgi:crossover junction endodeoxyribonuclease RuvC